MKYVITLGQKKDHSLVVLYLGNDVHEGKRACVNAQGVALAETMKNGRRIKHRRFGHLDPLPVIAPIQKAEAPEPEGPDEDLEESDTDAEGADEATEPQPKAAKRAGKPKSKPAPAESGEEDPLA